MRCPSTIDNTKYTIPQIYGTRATKRAKVRWYCVCTAPRILRYIISQKTHCIGALPRACLCFENRGKMMEPSPSTTGQQRRGTRQHGRGDMRMRQAGRRLYHRRSGIQSYPTARQCRCHCHCQWCRHIAAAVCSVCEQIYSRHYHDT